MKLESYVSKKGQEFGLYILDINHLDDVLNLQNQVLDDLGNKKQNHFIINRSNELLQKELESSTTIVYGMFDEKSHNLAAFAMISLPKDGENRPYSHIASHLPNSKIAIFQAMLVAPKYQGHGLMTKMVKVREESAKENGREIIIASVSKDNKGSKHVLDKSGFEIIGNGLNSHGRDTYYIGKTIDNDTNPDFVQKKLDDISCQNIISWQPVSNLQRKNILYLGQAYFSKAAGK